MAELIFETVQRGTHHYHKIKSFPVTIGRAFDNDVILQDATISPHHLIIEKEEDKLFIRNLSDENGTKIGREKMGDDRIEVSTPSSFKLSNIKARLLSSDMPVEDTYIKGCNGFFCIFNNPIWTICLFLITIGAFFYAQFLDTHTPKEIHYYLTTVFPFICLIMGISVIISVITRLTAHRWEILPAISVSSLIFLLTFIVEYLAQVSAYLFTNDALLKYLSYITDFVLIPTLIAIFIVKVVNKKWLPATGIAMLVYSPILAYQISNLIDEISLNSGFSGIPSYSQTLLPGDNRLNTTISLEQFMNEANRATSKNVKQMLIEAKKKEPKEY